MQGGILGELDPTPPPLARRLSLVARRLFLVVRRSLFGGGPVGAKPSWSGPGPGRYRGLAPNSNQIGANGI